MLDDPGQFLFNVLTLLASAKTDDEYIDLITVARDALFMYLSMCKENDQLEDEYSKFYCSLIRTIIDEDHNLLKETTRDELLTRFQSNPLFRRDRGFARTIKNLFGDPENVSNRRRTNLNKKIRSDLMLNSMNRKIRQMFGSHRKAMKSKDPAIQSEAIDQVLAAAAELARAKDIMRGSEDVPIESIDFSDPESIKGAFQVNSTKRTTHVWKMGLQGFSKMFGEHGGPCLGEFIVFGALQGNYKSMMLMQIARWLMTLNTPGPTGGKIPTVVFITLENEAHENLITWFRKIYTHTYGSIPPEDMALDEMVMMVMEAFGKRGFQFLIYRKMGSEFGFTDFQKLIGDLEADGRKVVASFIDYLALMTTKDLGAFANEAKAIQTLFHVTKDFANHTGMTIFSAAQLDAQADAIASEKGISHPVKRFRPGFFSDCKAIGKEVDGLFFLHVEKNHKKQSYLTISWARRRYRNPPDVKFCAYPFHPDFGIMDDIGGEPKYVTDIYADDYDPLAVSDKVEKLDEIEVEM